LIKTHQSRENPPHRRPSLEEVTIGKDSVKDENSLEPTFEGNSGRIIERSASVMFFVSASSLLFLSGLLHLSDNLDHKSVVIVCAFGYVVCWMACLMEAMGVLPRSSGANRTHWMYCLLPPLRMGARDRLTGTRIWLPRLGWQVADRELEVRLDRISSIPMIAIALMVLPLMAVEYTWGEVIVADPRLSGLMSGAAGLIWFAFAWEFIIRCSIAPKKLEYCLRHWIDLAIVLLPLISFLRAAQLGRLLRLQQLTRTARLYRLRGVALRAWRAMLLIDAVQRLLTGPPERRLHKLRATAEVKQQELDDLRREIARLESSLPAGADPLTSLSDDDIGAKPSSSANPRAA
jgi:hypothetical protein